MGGGRVLRGPLKIWYCEGARNASQRWIEIVSLSGILKNAIVGGKMLLQTHVHK